MYLLSDQCKTKYPIVMIHGVGFRDRKHLNYWGRIPDALNRNGALLFYGEQDSHGSIESNALQLKSQIEKILRITGSDKVNLIAHSKGGLDARYLISELNMAEYIASLTTLSTPHRGSATVDWLLSLPRVLVKIASHLANIWYRLLGDKTPDSYKLFHQLTTDYSTDFNNRITDRENVYYQSYAFIMHSALSDIVMLLPYLFVYKIEGISDGLVTPASATWGEFQGVITSTTRRGISHCDEVDMRRRPFTSKVGYGTVSDIVSFYVRLVTELKQRGY